MAVDKDCACKGINLMRDMMDAISMQGTPAGNKKAVLVAQKIQVHLKAQAMKDGNGELYEKASHSFDVLRDTINKIKFGDGLPGQSAVFLLDSIRHEIHITPALKQLMVCGGPFKDKDDMADEAKMLEVACNIAEEGDIQDCVSVLGELAKTLQC